MLYAVDYVNKADRVMYDLHKAIMQVPEGKPDTEYSASVRSLPMTMFKRAEMSALVFVGTNEELAEVGTSSTDVSKHNIVQRYECTPPKMRTLLASTYSDTVFASTVLAFAIVIIVPQIDLRVT
ncbi:hypothetical protein HPB51_005677 [Rhipicephalus microplus]|uniref:Uncharacterized protein n=1 Tax=Rhipicephalus microplus TaxID=6941 RepID=A0A9J6EY49_RHIMP|nr:hypothetical protein HPB51_005677 [Rhipicephalus microplus]